MIVLRDKLYSFTAKQGRPIQQQYHHYKDGKASATYVTAQSRVPLPMAMVKYPEAEMHV
jgi:hypothetical protein